MKKSLNLKTIAVLLIGVLCIISCEKSNLTTETNQILELDEVNSGGVDEQNEGFKSTTGNDGQVLENLEATVSPVLEIHFDKDVSMEEANLRFDKALKEYKSKQSGSQNKGYSTEFWFRVWVKTSTKPYTSTTGRVQAEITFSTSGHSWTTYEDLPNAGSGSSDYEGWDAYAFRVIPNRSFTSVSVRKGTLWLQGTDGWFVEEFVCQILADDQTVSASGFSGFWHSPWVWLDNQTSDGWDHYTTGFELENGTVNF